MVLARGEMEERSGVCPFSGDAPNDRSDSGGALPDARERTFSACATGAATARRKATRDTRLGARGGFRGDGHVAELELLGGFHRLRVGSVAAMGLTKTPINLKRHHHNPAGTAAWIATSGSITLKQDVETNDKTAASVSRSPHRATRAAKQDGCVDRRRKTNQPSKKNQKWGGSPGGRRVRRMVRGDARAPNPARVPSPAEIERALVNGGLCRGRARGGWLVTRMGSWRDGHHVRGEMVTMVMWLGTEQRTALHASARGRTESPPPFQKMRLGSIRRRARDMHRFRGRIVVVSFQIDGGFSRKMTVGGTEFRMRAQRTRALALGSAALESLADHETLLRDAAPMAIAALRRRVAPSIARNEPRRSRSPSDS